MTALPSMIDLPFRPALNENEIQHAVFDHLRMRGAKDIVAFHPKNGGIHQIGKRRGINAGLGVVSGASDVIILAPSGFYALELKADKGKPTVEQLLFLDRVRAAGGKSAWVAGIDAALRQLEEWGLLRGRSA